MLAKLERLTYQRKIKRLKSENKELRRMVDKLNKRLGDAETNNEYLMEVLSREKKVDYNE